MASRPVTRSSLKRNAISNQPVCDVDPRHKGHIVGETKNAKTAKLAADPEAVKLAVQGARREEAAKHAEAVKLAVEDARREEAAKHAEAVKLAVEDARREEAAKYAEAVKLAVEDARREEAAKHAKAIELVMEDARQRRHGDEAHHAEAVRLAVEEARRDEVAKHAETVKVAMEVARLEEAARLALQDRRSMLEYRDKETQTAPTKHHSADAAVQADQKSALECETQEQLDAAIGQLESPLLKEFAKAARENPLVKQFLMGHLGLGEIFMHPTMYFELATTELKGQAMQPMTWQRLFAAGKRALNPPSYKRLYDLMDTDNGRHLLAIVFTFVGGIVLRPEPQHLPIGEQLRNATSSIFDLPKEYKGTITEVSRGSKSFNCPLCCQVKLNKNAKQHIVTRKCEEDSNVSDEMRDKIAFEIRNNRFFIQERQLEQLKNYLNKQDMLSLQVVIMCLGGIILDSNYAPVSLYSVVSRK